IVALARADGRTCAFVEGNPEELLGINTKADLAAAEAIVQTELRAAAMAGGATLIDPDSVWLSHDTELGPDVVLHPHVVIGPGVRIAEGAVIKSFSHLEGAAIGKGAVVGPFARLRPGTDLGAHASIGNFVEAKNAVVGEGARINHLTYVGDAEIGAGTNIGAGTITCNYDGATKHKTVIGEDVFIGSNTVLIAPVEIGDGAFVAAASAITQNVEPGGLAVARARQVTKPERGRQLKEKLKARNKK
ncbi:MAG: DapH/DapD/GlmU-related protein, partial [Alphaproteobacteria bacterium]|nr:DapH/DapD/GlmU-related protein [Alphaproteobacteria bacterium]